MENNKQNKITKIIFSKYFKYIAVLSFFGIWITFFDSNSLYEQSKKNRELRELQNEYEKTLQKIIECKENDSLIQHNLYEAEYLGRTNYLMKCEDEDVFYFLKKKNGELVPFEE